MPHPKVKLSDDSGNTVAVDTSGSSNALKVSLLATPTIDIGDVSIKSGDGTAITDTISGRLDVTLDSNSGVYADDDDWTDGSSKHLLVGGLYQSSPQTVTDGDVAPFAMSSTGELHVEMTVGSVWQTYAAANDADLGTIATNSATVAGDTTEIAGYFLASGSSYAQRKGIVNIVLRTDALEAIPAGVADGDYSELQVDSVG